jgi:hypothetical protein
MADRGYRGGVFALSRVMAARSLPANGPRACPMPEVRRIVYAAGSGAASGRSCAASGGRLRLGGGYYVATP